MAPPEFCEVAVPLPLPTTFTYRVPAHLASLLRPGQRVVVPFQRRKLTGLVLGLTERAPAVDELKDVDELLDQEPVLGERLLGLGRWMADYYLAPPGEVFATLLPLGLAVRRVKLARITEAGRERFRLLEHRPELSEEEIHERTLLKAFADGRTKRLDGLLQRRKLELSLFERLRLAGLVELSEGLRRRKDSPEGPMPAEPRYERQTNELTADQATVLREIQSWLSERQFRTALLHGVTGSGKTEVYLRAIEACHEQGASALMLVPEISLTPAVAGLFSASFGERVAILHSGLAEGERAREWWRIRRGEARIVVGTRSAVFAPLENLALIIVDEEQDSSYKQEETPKYNGRDVAIMRGKLEAAVVLLGSATPALESYYHARAGKYHPLAMRSRVENRPLAAVEIVDMRREFDETHETTPLSRRLREELVAALGRGEQALVLLNRRGYALFLLCRHCGAAVQCENCSISLTYHKWRQRLVCHYCDYQRAVPAHCPKCRSEYLYFVGEGAEKIQEYLRAELPAARIARLDRDTASGRRRYREILGTFAAGEIDILVGTQLIAKGHDFHRVTLVGVVSADIALGLPDFRAGERTFQLLTQVAGRAGRGALAGRVIVQSYHPDHYAIQYAAQQDYADFYERELKFRRLMHYPPVTSLANVVVRHPKRDKAENFARMLSRFLAGKRSKDLKILGPAAAPIARLKRDYRFQFLLKSPRRGALHRVLRELLAYCRQKEVPLTHVLIDVDPLRLM